MQCAVHADRPATHSVGEEGACADCAVAAQERARFYGGAVPVLVAIAYLVVLAIAYVALKGRPIVGGLAAVAALFAGRALQMYLLRPVTTLPPPAAKESES